MSQSQAWLQFRDTALQNLFGFIIRNATDCTFKIESSGEEFSCHKTLLRAASPWLNVSFFYKKCKCFRLIFLLFWQDIFKDQEAQSLGDCIIVLENVKLQEFKVFLGFVYGEKQDIAEEDLRPALQTFGIFLPHQDSVSSTSSQCKSPAGVITINQPSETTKISNGCNKENEAVPSIGEDADVPSSRAIPKLTEEGQKLSREQESVSDFNRSDKKRKSSGQIIRTKCGWCKATYTTGYVSGHEDRCAIRPETKDTGEAARPHEKESQS